MKQPTMVYKFPGTMHIDREGGFDFKIVEGHVEEGEESSAVDQALEDGWFTSTKEAKAAVEEVSLSAPVTREELETMAIKLGIKFDGRTSDKKLQAEIDEALKQSEDFM